MKSQTSKKNQQRFLHSHLIDKEFVPTRKPHLGVHYLFFRWYFR